MFFNKTVKSCQNTRFKTPWKHQWCFCKKPDKMMLSSDAQMMKREPRQMLQGKWKGWAAQDHHALPGLRPEGGVQSQETDTVHRRSLWWGRQFELLDGRRVTKEAMREGWKTTWAWWGKQDFDFIPYATINFRRIRFANEIDKWMKVERILKKLKMASLYA